MSALLFPVGPVSGGSLSEELFIDCYDDLGPCMGWVFLPRMFGRVPIFGPCLTPPVVPVAWFGRPETPRWVSDG